MKPSDTWFRRHARVLTRVAFALLVTVVAVESALLIEERAAHRAVETQSERLLTTFLRGDTTQTPRAAGVSVRLQNVRFRWSDKVYIDAGNMALRAVPVRGTAVDFDNLDSFMLALQRSVVLIRPDVLEGMLNESVFNYPESKVRDLKVTLRREGTDYAVKVNGRVNVLTWIPFSMVVALAVDSATNTLVMNVDRLKVLGIIPATKLIHWSPFKLARLITLPPNNTMMIDGNRIMVKPFGLFPPPRVTGTMSAVSLDALGIRLSFAGNPIPAPVSPAPNYVYLKGGTSCFGRLCMVGTDVLILDRNPTDPFSFSVMRWADLIPRSDIKVLDSKAIRVTMPDT